MAQAALGSRQLNREHGRLLCGLQGSHRRAGRGDAAGPVLSLGMDEDHYRSHSPVRVMLEKDSRRATCFMQVIMFQEVT